MTVRPAPHRPVPAMTPSKTPRTWGAVLLMGLLAAPVLAQGVYRIVGPDGRVTFSDQPPLAGAASTQPLPPSATGGNAIAALPFELRRVATRYPVTIYTSSDCAPCNSGRNLLNSRGVPYVEKTVTTAQDAEALKRLSGEASMPFMTIGSQPVRGYSDAEWTQFLDAAGYPKQSVLPANYRRPAPAPLVVVKPVEPAAAPRSAAPSPAAEPAPVPVTPPADNPAGIRF